MVNILAQQIAAVGEIFFRVLLFSAKPKSGEQFSVCEL